MTKRRARKRIDKNKKYKEDVFNNLKEWARYRKSLDRHTASSDNRCDANKTICQKNKK